MKLEKSILKNILTKVLIVAICAVIFIYQIQKVGFHEDEGYTLASSVNPTNGLMIAYDYVNMFQTTEKPVWKTKEFVKDYMQLSPNNYFNFGALYVNQAMDNHPPFFYTLVHFSTMIFAGNFTKYSVFLVNIIAFAISCVVLEKILKLLNKENLVIGALIFYGLSMGTISMVLYQRMYMLLNMFIMLYFYYSLKIYKNNFEIDKKMIIKLGIVTILGFLTQYFFAIYAVIIFLMLLIKMIKDKKIEAIKKYVVSHIVYAVVGVLLFVPSVYHILFSGRGISNLESGGYLEHFGQYIYILAYAFSIKENFWLVATILILFFAGIGFWYKKSNEKFIVLLMTIPSIIYFILAVKLTPFRELRYIMAVIPFIVLILFFVLDNILKIKWKNTILVALSIIFVVIGIIFSQPKFLYTNYEKILDIAKENSDKSFVYVYDNCFNHMQSIPEMMIYPKTLIINATRDEIKYVINDENLNKEDSYILSIKSYMNNDEILNEIKNNSPFKNVQKLYSANSDNVLGSKVENELYLMSK